MGKISRRNFIIGSGTALALTRLDDDQLNARKLLRNEAALAALPHHITATKPLELKVGEHLPSDIPIMDGCNNLDLINHNDKYYLAFRTAPTHFASSRTLMHILSSDDALHWQHEETVKMYSDLREPRFLSLNERLFFYFFKAGTDWTKFEPQHIYNMERKNGLWQPPQECLEPGYVPWRFRNHGGKAFLSVYYGKDLYDGGNKSKAQILKSDDGLNWEPFTKEIKEQGVEELEFIFGEDEMWGTVRLEGHGGAVVHSTDMQNFSLKKTANKYDSALMLSYGSEIYLIARRNVDGAADKNPSFLPDGCNSIHNLVRYSATTKRTALYHLDKRDQKMVPLFDFDSHGDTAFPAVTKISENKFLFYNYSSPLTYGLDYIWFRGQISQTKLYAQVLTFEDK